MAGVEPGLLPLEFEGPQGDPSEERRLPYVAMTRAKRLLVLSHAARRTLFGQVLPGGPSPLLDSLPDAAVARSTPSLSRRRPQHRQLSLFD